MDKNMLFNLAYRNIFRNIKRSLISMASVGVVSMGLILFFAFSDGFNESLKTSLKNYVSGDFYISNKKFKDYSDINPLGFLLEESLVKPLFIQNPEWTINPILETFATVYKDGSFLLSLGVMGIQFDKTIQEKIFLVEGRYPSYNPEFPQVREILLRSAFAQINNFKMGDEIVLLSQTATGSTNAMNFTIVGFVDFGVENFNASYSAIPLDLAQRFLFAQGYVTRYLVYVQGGESAIPQSLEVFNEYLIASNLEDNIMALPWYETEIMPFLQVKTINVNIMGALFFILGSIVIANTTLMTVLERKKEIGVLRALGMRKGEVRVLFFIESFLIGIIGTIIGIIIGAILTIPFSYWGIEIGEVAKNGGKILGPSEMYFLVTSTGVLTVFIFSIIINFLISYLSTIRVTKISPRESMSS